MKDITVIGIDTAKNYIQLHGANEQGKAVFKKRLTREAFLPFMANLPKCLIGMEACGGAHHWAVELEKLGFKVKLMSPRKVKRYADPHNKNDANDAAACAEAATRANVPAVSIKNAVQMEIQSRHRVRTYFVKQRTGLMNMMRGLLYEMGISIPKSKSALRSRVSELLDPINGRLTDTMRCMMQGTYDMLKNTETQVALHTAALELLAKEDIHCQRISTIPGIGPISATAVVAKIGNGSEFKKGRGLSAYLGLVPRQHSSGDKQCLGRISKHGDRYIRQLLIHGGRSILRAVMRVDKETGAYVKNDSHSQWARNLISRVGMNKAAVALANKNGRIMIAVLKKQENFQSDLAHLCEAA
jgi:transposase